MGLAKQADQVGDHGMQCQLGHSILRNQHRDDISNVQVRGVAGGAGGEGAGLGGPLHHSGSGSGSHTPMDIDEGIEIPPEKVKNG